MSLAAGGGGNAVILSILLVIHGEPSIYDGPRKAVDNWRNFKILSESPYNGGAAAASMAVLRNKYGDLYREGLNRVQSQQSLRRAAV